MSNQWLKLDCLLHLREPNVVRLESAQHMVSVVPYSFSTDFGLEKVAIGCKPPALDLKCSAVGLTIDSHTIPASHQELFKLLHQANFEIRHTQGLAARPISSLKFQAGTKPSVKSNFPKR